ncbi:MAG: YceI family protein [Spirochaetaceae bacterium]|nr:MAG: YceI family protein [Spirochaetaceae bacterium]
MVGLILVAGLGFLGYIWISGGSGQASAPVEALRLEPQEPESTVFEVDQSRSEARFIIEEVLRGRPNTVVGVTNQIDGSIAVGFDPIALEIGEFVINVRTVRTDDEVRDRTIRSMILESNRDEFEFSRFAPRSISGLPESVAHGVTFSFDVLGDLTIRDVTAPVTFQMTAQIVSDTELRGTAQTVVLWDDFDIVIPYVGGNSIVASVGDSVTLEMEYFAIARD